MKFVVWFNISFVSMYFASHFLLVIFLYEDLNNWNSFVKSSSLIPGALKYCVISGDVIFFMEQENRHVMTIMAFEQLKRFCECSEYPGLAYPAVLSSGCWAFNVSRWPCPAGCEAPSPGSHHVCYLEQPFCLSLIPWFLCFLWHQQLWL